MRTTTRCREYREGWLGRRRNYLCRKCGNKFQVDTRNPLPESDRICPSCVKAVRWCHRLESTRPARSNTLIILSASCWSSTGWRRAITRNSGFWWTDTSNRGGLYSGHSIKQRINSRVWLHRRGTVLPGSPEDSQQRQIPTPWTARETAALQRCPA